MSRKVSSMYEINDTKETWKLAVRITNLWYVQRSPTVGTIEMLFIDEQGDKIHAVVKNLELDKWKTILQEERTYIVENVEVQTNEGQYKICSHRYKLFFTKATFVREHHLPAIPVSVYNFTSFEDIISGHASEDVLIDVIGEFVDLVHYQPESKPKKVIFCMEDQSGRTLSCTLWEAYATQLLSFLEEHESVHGHIVIVLTLAKIKDSKGKYPVAIQNSMYGSKLLINENIIEIQQYKNSLDSNHDCDSYSQRLTKMSSCSQISSTDRFLQNSQIKSITEINELKQECYCITLAEIDKIFPRNGWSYEGCSKCNRKVDPLALSNICPGCGKDNSQTITRFRVETDLQLQESEVFVWKEAIYAGGEDWVPWVNPSSPFKRRKKHPQFSQNGNNQLGCHIRGPHVHLTARLQMPQIAKSRSRSFSSSYATTMTSECLRPHMRPPQRSSYYRSSSFCSFNMGSRGHNSASSSSGCSNFLSSALRTKRLVSPAEKAAIDNSSGRGLSRRLGVLDLVLLGVGASIGAGIFVVTGTVARDVGPGVTISFILAGASCVINALCYAELASRFPAVVGGAYLYAYTAFNELTAFLVFAQLMLDYHIGAASIARSLASYVVNILELFPVFKDNIPKWIGHGENIGDVLSINVLAPILLMLLTLILCRGVEESSAVNSFMTVTKVVIVIIVIFAGAFEVDVSNWSPFAPNGIGSIFTGATVVFFAYVGFDAVANSAEESKRPQRDLPIAIIGSLLICIALYIGVCLVITGMVPYTFLGEDAPLAEAFKSKGLKFVSVLISIGAIAGLTTTLLVGLYVQSRLYLGLGRDGLLPSIFAKVHPKRHTPIHSQVWAGVVASVLAGLFNVRMLSHILSVGTLTGYSVVSACVVALRWKDRTNSQVSSSAKQEGVICLIAVAVCGFGAGLIFRYDASFIFLILAIVLGLGASALLFRQVYADAQGFSCPGVPLLPAICIFFNMFLFGQLHYEAWVRFVIVSVVMVGVYAVYGQYHADPSADENIYHVAPQEEA